MRVVKMFLIVLLLSGCSVKTTITDPDGRMYVVNSRKNAVVEYSEGNAKIRIDNRGLHGFISELIGAVVVGNNVVRKEAE